MPQILYCGKMIAERRTKLMIENICFGIECITQKIGGNMSKAFPFPWLYITWNKVQESVGMAYLWEYRCVYVH